MDMITSENDAQAVPVMQYRPALVYFLAVADLLIAVSPPRLPRQSEGKHLLWPGVRSAGDGPRYSVCRFLSGRESQTLLRFRLQKQIEPGNDQ